jgi:uncharacterized phage protein gp47/JayE
MGLLDFLPLFQEDADSIRARMDADANAGLYEDDPRWIDTREGTFYYDITQVLVLEFARLYDALAVDVPASAFVAVAWGEYLDLHAQVFNLERKAAVAATTEVIFVGDPGTLVGSGTVVSLETENDEGDVIEFVTTESGTTSNLLDEPENIMVSASASGGTLATNDYFYEVTAISDYGETTPADEVEITVVGPTGSVALDWDDVPGAVGYRVYRGLVAGGVKQRVYEGAASGFTDTGAAAPVATGVPDQNTTAGVRLAVEAITAGSAGNVAAFAITSLDTPNAGIDVVYNPEPATGGTEPELDDELRERILLEYGGQGAGNISDYKRWALAFPGVGRVFVNPVWDGPSTVQVVVMGSDGDPVASTVVDGLQQQLDPIPGQGAGLAPIGAIVTVQTPTVLPIAVIAPIAFAPGYSLDGGSGTTARRAEIEAALKTYINGLEVGEDVVYEHVKAQFFTVEGIYNISSVQVNGDTKDVAVTSNPPQTAQLASTTLV